MENHYQRTLRKLLVPFALLCLSPFLLAQHDEGVSMVGRDPETPFRYVIVEGVSEIEKFVNKDPKRLHIEVLMEDKAFNEKNLIKLFDLISRRFVSKESLWIAVYTSLDAIFTPEERDGQAMYERVSDYKRFKYAFMYRNGYGDFFYYAIPGKVKEKKVILRAGPTR